MFAESVGNVSGKQAGFPFISGHMPRKMKTPQGQKGKPHISSGK